MRLIVWRRIDGAPPGATLLEYALSTVPLNGVVFDALRQNLWDPGDSGSTTTGQEAPMPCVMPREWSAMLPGGFGPRIDYGNAVRLDAAVLRRTSLLGWLVISDGRFVTRTNSHLLQLALGTKAADAVAVMIDPQLTAYREHIRLTPQGRLVGYRRLYLDSMEPIPVPSDWPHHLFLRGRIVESALNDGLPAQFRTFVQMLRSRGVQLKALAVAGRCVDLNTQDGLLSLGRMSLDDAATPGGSSTEAAWRTSPSDGDCEISPQSRFVGPVLLGSHVCVEPDAVIIGPSILCDNSRIRRGAVIDASIVGANGEVVPDQVVRNALIAAQPLPMGQGPSQDTSYGLPAYPRMDNAFAFRSWSRFSYARCFKRAADVIVAAIVLTLFAPIIPFIALAIKINSPGPVFFKHKRQGFHGKPFHCIKFRTMIAGADSLQDFLRFISEVDGPQFKVADDPRITTVGRFLRETFLDEIPQFYNVLVGDMSVVGPRPSPEAENTLCPWWRDARLSVRPGITGLWQISRTRKPSKDFQEWIHYDTEYVRRLSLRLDLWICVRTFGKMVRDFIRQF